MKEVYKDIEGYEGYQVSNMGNVKSFKGKKERILKAGLSSVGYLIVGLSKNGKAKTFQIHQLVCIAFLNHVPNGSKGLVADHRNNNPLDNRLDNLQLITHRLNSSKDQNNCSSKYTGVCWDEARNKWRSSIMINGKIKHLGYFTNELDASKCYQNALKNL